MKKLFVIATLFIGIITLAACSQTGSQTSDGPTLETKEDVIGFTAATSIMALNNTQTVDPLLNVDNHTTDDPYDFLNNIEAVEQFMPIINAFLSSDAAAFDVAVVESDLPEYDNLMVISMLDFNGETLNYEFYYNETMLSEDDEDDDEAYEESAIDGIMIIDNQTYQLSGVRESEAGEEYLEMQATIDELNFVTIEYGAEQEGTESATEFYYDVIENGVNIQSIEFELENENEESALSLIFVEGSRESEFSFELENEDGMRTLEIEFLIEEDGSLVDEGEIEAEITFDETTQKYIITYTVTRGDEEEIYEDEYDDDDEDDDDDTV